MAAVLTLVQTKQIRINIHKRNNTKNHATNKTKHSKYKYTFYQKKRILNKTHTYAHPHITKQDKTTTVQVKTNTVQYIPT